MPSDADSPDSEPLKADPDGAPPSEKAPSHPLSGAISNALQGRLHPMTLVFGIIGGWDELRKGFFQILPLAVGLYAGNRLLFMALLIFLVLYPPVRAGIIYFTFQYGIESGELVTRQGLIKRTERHVPLERVQDLRIEQNILQQFFGVVAAYVETAGGTGAEATLSVISRTEAERLRQAIFERSPRPAHGATEGEAASPSQVIRRLEVKEIVLAGLSSNRAASILVFLLVGWSFLDEILPEAVYDQMRQFLREEFRFLSQQGIQVAALVVVMIVLTALLLSMCLSVIGSVLLFYGFTLSRDGEDLQRYYGLLTRRSSSLPRRRIQVLEIEEGLLRRWLGLATLRADIAGGSAGPNASETGRDVLLPVIPREEVESLLPTFFPDLEEGSPEWRRVSKRAILRGTISGGIKLALLMVGLLWFYRSWVGLWPMALVPALYLINVKAYRNLGYALGVRYFRTRRGWSGRSTHVVPIRNIQSVALHQTLFERRMGLATLVLDTAGQAFTGGGPHVANLPIGEAESLARTLAKSASETRYRWEGRR